MPPQAESSTTPRHLRGLWRYYTWMLAVKYGRYMLLSVLAAAAMSVLAREYECAGWCIWSLAPSLWMLFCLAASMSACGLSRRQRGNA